MASAKGRKLKVFQAPFGFHESVVAAPSQAAALRAWGSHQNLFAEGLAHVAGDQAAIDAALAHPEVPLRRAIGSSDPFALVSKSLPKVPDAQKQPKPAKAAKAKPPEPPPRDRTELDAAEAALSKLDADHNRQEEDFSRRWDELHREQEDARRVHQKAKDKAEAEVTAARRAYEKTGGR